MRTKGVARLFASLLLAHCFSISSVFALQAHYPPSREKPALSPFSRPPRRRRVTRAEIFRCRRATRVAPKRSVAPTLLKVSRTRSCHASSVRYSPIPPPHTPNRPDTNPHATKGDPWEPVEPKVRGASAAPVEALDVAGDVTACDPFGGAPRRKMTGPFCVSASGHPEMKAARDTSGKLSIPWGRWASCIRPSWVWIVFAVASLRPRRKPVVTYGAKSLPPKRSLRCPLRSHYEITDAPCLPGATGKGLRAADESLGAPLGPPRGPIPARYRCVGPALIP